MRMANVVHVMSGPLNLLEKVASLPVSVVGLREGPPLQDPKTQADL